MSQPVPAESAPVSAPHPPPASSAAAADERAAADLRRRNRMIMLGYEFLWGLAQPFLFISTMHTGYLDSLGAGTILIGLVPAVFAAGYSFVGPFSAGLLSGRRAFAATVAGYMLAGIGMATAGAVPLLAPQADPLARYSAYAFGLLCWTACIGLGDPHYIGYALEAAEPDRRGSFFARRWLCFGVGGVIGGELSRRLLEAVPAPDGFAWGFVAGGALLVASTAGFTAFRASDPAAAGDERPGPIAGARRLLADPAVRRLLAAFCLFTVGQQVFPFLALALTHGTGAGKAAGFVGNMNVAFMAGTALWAPVVGRISDGVGPRAAFGFMAVLFAGGLLGAVGLTHVQHDLTPAAVLAGAWLCYFAASIWQPGQGIVFNNMMADVAPSAPTAQAIALMGAVLLPLRLLVPPAAGWAIDRWDYGPALIAAAGAALGSAVAMRFARPTIGSGSPQIPAAR